jgi:hypothetical protein
MRCVLQGPKKAKERKASVSPEDGNGMPGGEEAGGCRRTGTLITLSRKGEVMEHAGEKRWFTGPGRREVKPGIFPRGLAR